jgi:hypothetical protein
MEIAGRIRSNPRSAINKTDLWDEARMAHVLERWLYWRHIADKVDEMAAHTMEMGE